jgi:hypothetical protein
MRGRREKRHYWQTDAIGYQGGLRKVKKELIARSAAGDSWLAEVIMPVAWRRAVSSALTAPNACPDMPLLRAAI